MYTWGQSPPSTLTLPSSPASSLLPCSGLWSAPSSSSASPMSLPWWSPTFGFSLPPSDAFIAGWSGRLGSFGVATGEGVACCGCNRNDDSNTQSYVQCEGGGGGSLVTRPNPLTRKRVWWCKPEASARDVMMSSHALAWNIGACKSAETL